MQFNYCSIAKNKITGNTLLKGDNIIERIMEINGGVSSFNEIRLLICKLLSCRTCDTRVGDFARYK